MSEGLLVRDVREADIPAVREVLVATWEATYTPLVGAQKVAQMIAAWHSPEALAAQLGQPGAVFLLAQRQDVVIGTSLAVLHGGAVCLRRLYVLPIEQGRGAGRLLLEATLARFPQAFETWLEVEPRNSDAIAFYRRRGFHLEEVQGTCGGRQDMGALIMRRPPAPSP